jgi:hypothetical protein
LLLLDLSFQQTIFVSASLTGLLQLRDFYLEIFDMFFLSFAECALRGTILRLAFLVAR